MPDETDDNSNITTLRVNKDDIGLLRDEKVRYHIAKKTKRLAPNDPELFHDIMTIVTRDLKDDARQD